MRGITGALVLAMLAPALPTGGAHAQDKPSAAAPSLKPPSAADLGAKAFVENPKLAPDGHAYAALAFVKGQTNLVVITPKGKQERPDIRVFGMPPKQEMVWFRWAGSNRLIVSLAFSSVFGDEEVRVTRMVVVDLVTGKQTPLIMRQMGFDGDNVIHVDQAGNFALVEVQPSVYDYPGVYRFDLATGKYSTIVEPMDNVWDWYADSAGVVRTGVAVDGNKWWVVYRDADGAKFQRTSTRNRDQSNDNVEWFSALPGKASGYALALSDAGRFALRRYDFVKDELGEVVWQHPSVDIDDVDFGPDGEPTAIYYTDDRQRVAWLDPELKRLQTGLDKAMPGASNRILSISRDRSRALIESGSAHEVPVYVLYDRATKSIDVTAVPYGQMMDKQLAPMEYVTYKARDGLEIPGYLTLPVGKPAKGLPLIVMPHGGPFVRDEWRYDYWVQYLATRGYAVLQPNYRGSTGYGTKYAEAGTGAWGRGMQDDMDDGVKWLAEKGVIDPKRVCMMGGSFGGYAAMWAAARNPDIYRCAISFAGVSDVRALLRFQSSLFSAPKYFRDWRARVAGQEKFDFDTISPLKNADKIAIPLLLVHGTADTRVPFNQSRKLHEALTKLGKPHEWVVYKDETHFLEDPANATDFLERVGKFLDQHNPA